MNTRASEGGQNSAPLTQSERALGSAIIGSLIVGGRRALDVYWELSTLIGPDEFQVPEQRLVYEAVEGLIKAGLPLGVEPIARWIDVNRKAAADAFGGAFPLVAGIAAESSISGSCIEYALMLRESRFHRDLQDAGRRIAALPPGTVETMTAEANRILTDAISKSFRSRESMSIGVAAEQAQENIMRIRETPEGLQGPTTTLRKMDDITSGLRRACLIVLAGRPAMGKTSLGQQMAESCESDGIVPFFSLEMPAASLGRRELARITGIDMKKLMHPKLLTDHDLHLITIAVGKLRSERLMEIIDDPRTGPKTMLARAHTLARRHGKLGGILVDYLQLIQIEIEKGRAEQNRVAELAEISAMLREAAKTFKCPVIALSQLSRKLEERTDKRPILSDLRDSGAIEQEADIVATIYREHVYNKNADPLAGEIGIPKNRDGETGIVYVQFEGSTQRWSDAPGGTGYFSGNSSSNLLGQLRGGA